MIQYPSLENEATIGVTAPSSGVKETLHSTLKMGLSRLEKMGFKLVLGESIWHQDKAKSLPAKKRADEFNKMLNDDNINMIFPPWGGELLIEMLEYIDFEKMNPKWILGYSDISGLLMAITLKTGIATAHGTNLFDLRGEYSDETTAKWQTVLSTKVGDSVVQHSSTKYQKEWQFNNPTPYIFHLTEPTTWKTISKNNVKVHGRLLGGCIDVIRHLVGTPYGDVTNFRKQYLHEEPILWYLENCELSTVDLRRSLVQMKLAGWFEGSTGIMFGRSPANHPIDNYTAEEVYKDLSEELEIPILYDIDCGHVPPQITFVNGAYAEVKVTDGKGTVLQRFKP